MKIRKLACWCAVLLGAAGLVQARVDSDTVTMLVVPAHYSVVQVSMDLYRFYPTILVSYQAGSSDEDPVLYAWSGREWLYVSCDDYLSGRFFRYAPQRVVLVGGDAEMPALLADGPAWTPLVIKVPTLKTPELINAMGRVYNFDGYTWKWFAKRYSLDLVDVNEPDRQKSWYDGTFVEKQMTDGTIQKVYVPPEGIEEDVLDATILKVEQKRSLVIPLKAAPPRGVETISTEVDQIGTDEYEVIDKTDEEFTFQGPGGDQVTVEEEKVERKTFRLSPSSAYPAAPAQEKSVFYEYTEEDMQTMERVK